MTDHRTEDAGNPIAGDDASDVAFVADVAPVLRDPVSLDTAFESRVMTAVHTEVVPGALARRTSDGSSTPTRGLLARFRRRRSIELSPLAALGLAAGIVGFVYLGTLLLAARNPGSSSRDAASPVGVVHDTVRMIRFVFVDTLATGVAVVGDFNGWNPAAAPLAPSGAAGVWAVSLPLASGRHEYAFFVDGKRWTTDPFAPRRADEFDTETSVVMVGDASR